MLALFQKFVFISLSSFFCFPGIGVEAAQTLNASYAEREQDSLPGRVGQNSIYYTQLGNTRIFYYMTPEKDSISRQFVADVNSNILLGMDVAAKPCPISEVVLLSSKYPEAINFNSDGQPTYKDKVGRQIVEKYVENVKRIAENTLGVDVQALSSIVSLNINFDALKVHRERFYAQYDFLSKLPSTDLRYSLFQDLTLIDWQMAKGTFAATMVQDGDQGDRFLMIIFPTEIVGTVYTEPAIYPENNLLPVYPGHITFPYHSSVSPTDYLGSLTVGSWKGKWMNTSVRGVVLQEEIEKLADKAILLPINRFETKRNMNGLVEREYLNGIVLKEFSQLFEERKFPEFYKHEDKENVSILESAPTYYSETVQNLKTLFSLDKSIQKVFLLRKQDGGFSHLRNLLLDIPPSSTVVLLNRSHLPSGYKPFVISEDCTTTGKPWIHLYHFPHNMAMKVSEDVFNCLSLAPLEELLYREEISDSVNSEPSVLMEKLITEIEVFIFS